MNNTIPAWLFGAFGTAFNNFKEMRISLEEFVRQIESLPEVPQPVKDNWRSKLKESS